MSADVRSIAIIPARGGSKRMPRKNLLRVHGRSLIEHTVRHALAAQLVSETFVSTEDPEIAELARRLGAEVITRPPQLAGDAASSESALLHVLDVLAEQRRPEPDLLVFLQCTSPVRHTDDIDNAIRLLLDRGVDSVFSACRDAGLLWTMSEHGPAPLNYEPARRRREQEMDPQMRENGSIYVTRPKVLREAGHRLGGSVAVYEMDALRSVQVDGPGDVELAAWAMTQRQNGQGWDWPARLDLVVFDFDGVMTDNVVYVGEDGRESVRCSRADGLGISELRRAGIPMLVLSTERNPVVTARCAKLGLECRHGIVDKASELSDALRERGIHAPNVAYVGNDVNDLGCLQLVGLPVVVADADPGVMITAPHVLSRRGGDGAVREFTDLLLRRYVGAGGEQ